MARNLPTGNVPEAGDARSAPAGDDAGYTVVARRYRPQTFEDLVGQDHVVQALRNAITLGRITHAYLFCGTRGVGKTSIARIFAKCLNCVHGPTITPCNVCDICRAISVGQDVDVIEIDGASNNGVESVRELRQNAGLRPSRARFKIYYIDEVHMLSTGAFNALLKTLEEPPEHVKFLFATTEPNKIPITVLSRCQRYDFAGITPDQIAETLAGICVKERVKAETDALATIARRAGGSMRDAQSLLEQMLSYGGNELTSEGVHRALGIAPDERILDLIDALADRDPARALLLIENSSLSGVQPADLLAGSLDFLRDVMVTKVGPSVPLLAAAPSQKERLKAVAERWPLDTILAAMQILDQAKGRLRGSPHGRLIVELAFVRAARLEDFAELGELIGRLNSGATSGPSSDAVKKKSPAPDSLTPITPRPTSPAPSPRVSIPRENGAATTHVAVAAPPAPEPLRLPTATSTATTPLTLEEAVNAWQEGMLGQIKDIGLVSALSQVRPSSVEGSGVVVVAVPARYSWIVDKVEPRRDRVESALSETLGRPISVRFNRSAPAATSNDSASHATPEPPAPATLPERLAADPWVRQNIIELFETAPYPVRFELDDGGED